MGMSTHVEGIVPPNGDWEKMKAAYYACREAGVEIPDTIMKYFDYRPPDPSGTVIDLDRHESIAEWSDDYRSGFEVHVDKLPSHVKIIRFYNSW